MTLRLELDPVQTRAWRMIAPGVNTFAWGRGTGKTWFGRMLVLQWALSKPGQQVGILYPTLKQARQVVWPLLWQDLLGPLRRHVKKKDASLLEVILANGSTITTWGAENAHGIRGQRFTHLLQDEADDIDPGVEHSVVEPTFSKAGLAAIWAKFGTPRRGRHGVLYRDYQLGQQESEPGYVSLKVKSEDSPQVDRHWLERIRRKTPRAIFAREYECDFDSAEGLVYPFDESFHVRAPPEHFRFTEYGVGVDHGWEDPGVHLLIGVHGHGNDAIAWVLDEIYERHKPPHWWDERAKEWAHAKLFACDPSRPDRINSLQQAGVNATGADNKIEPGVARVADLLSKRQTDDGAEWSRLYVHPKCRNLIWELNNYRRKRDPRDSENFLEAIEDKNNHGCDALRYYCVERFGRLEIGRVEVPGR